MLHNLFFWSGPTAIDVISRAMVMILLIATLDIEAVGTINLAILLFSYFTLSHLGLVDGLKLRLSSLNVTKQEFFFDKYSNSVCSLNLILSFSLFILLLMAFLGLRTALSAPVWLGILSVALSNIFYSFFTNQILYFRYKFEIRNVSLIRLVPACVRVFIQLPCAILFGLVGFFICEPLVFLTPSLLLFKKRQSFVFKMPSKKILKDVWTLGMPVFLIGVTDLLMVTQDRVIIASSNDLDVFGNYAVAAYVCSIFLFLPSQALSLVGQQLREWFSIGLSPVNAFKIKQNIGFVVILSWALGGPLVFSSVYLLGQYEFIKVQNILSILPFIWATLLIRLSISITNSIFIVIERGGLVFVFNIVGVCLTFSIVVWSSMTTNFGNVMGVILATMIGLFVQALISLFSFSFIYRGTVVATFTSLLFTASCLYLLMFWSLAIFLPARDTQSFVHTIWFDAISFETQCGAAVAAIVTILTTGVFICRTKKLREMRCLLERKYVDH